MTEALKDQFEMPLYFLRYRILGSYKNRNIPTCYLCLDEQTGGSVIGVNFEALRCVEAVVQPVTYRDPYGNEATGENVAFTHEFTTRTTYYNSSIRQFLECHLVLEELRADLEKVNWDELDANGYDKVTEGFQNALRRECLRIDPIALEGANTFWTHLIDRYFA